MKGVSQLELDLLLIFYNFSDQNGVVDVRSARAWARNKLGVHIPTTPVTLTQTDIDILMDKSVVPDTRELLQQLMKGPTAK